MRSLNLWASELTQSSGEGYIDFGGDFALRIRRDIYATFDEAQWSIFEDLTEPTRSEIHLAHGESESDLEKFYYLRRHPTLCELMIFRFSLLMNELGLCNCNQWGASSKSSHLIHLNLSFALEQ